MDMKIYLIDRNPDMIYAWNAVFDKEKDIFIIHGAKIPGSIDNELYFLCLLKNINGIRKICGFFFFVSITFLSLRKPIFSL